MDGAEWGERMRLHLSSSREFLSQMPLIPPVVYGSLVIYYASPFVILCSFTGEVVCKLKYENVQVLSVFENFLVIGVSELYFVSLNGVGSAPIVDIVRMSKSLISHLVFYEGLPGLCFFGVAKFNNRIRFYRGGNIVLDCYSKGGIVDLLISEEAVGYIDEEEVVLFDILGVEMTRMSSGNVIRGYIEEKKLCLLMEDGGLYSKSISKLKEISKLSDSEDSEYNFVVENFSLIYTFELNITYSCYRSGILYCTDSSKIIEYRNGVVKTGNLSCMFSECDISETEEAKRRKLDGEHSIVFVSETLFMFDNSLVFHQDYEIFRMLFFNNDITDSVTVKNKLILATLTGCIRWSGLLTAPEDMTSREMLFSGKMLKLHSDAITAITYKNGMIITGSKDRHLKAWEVLEGDEFGISGPIYTQELDSEITAISVTDSNIAVGTYDGHVYLFHKESGSGTEFKCYFKEQYHRKQITGIEMRNSLVVTTSSDKTALFFRPDGTVIKRIQGELYMAVSGSENLVAIASNRGIRAFDESANQTQFFPTTHSVLTLSFYRSYLVTLTDLLRIYDIKKGKCVKSYDFGLENCWSISMPFLCAENKVVEVADESLETHQREVEEKRKEREDGILLDKHRREGNTREELEILSKKDDHSKTFKAIYKGFERERGLGFLEVFSGKKDRLISVLNANPAVKYAEVFNEIVSRTNLKDKDTLRICERQQDSIDSLYIKLLSFINRH